MTDQKRARVYARQARDNLANEEDAAVDAFHRAYPPGSTLSWQRGGSVHAGRVVEHLYGQSLRVRNDRSGKIVKVSHYDVFAASDD